MAFGLAVHVTVRIVAVVGEPVVIFVTGVGVSMRVVTDCTNDWLVLMLLFPTTMTLYVVAAVRLLKVAVAAIAAVWSFVGVCWLSIKNE